MMIMVQPHVLRLYGDRHGFNRLKPSDHYNHCACQADNFEAADRGKQ